MKFILLLCLLLGACVDAKKHAEAQEAYRRNGELIPGGRVLYQDEYTRLTEITLGDSTRCVVKQHYGLGDWHMDADATVCGGGRR